MTSDEVRGNPLIFLSHSGLDKTWAEGLTFQIEAEFAYRGYTVNIFNTSDPEYRFTKWKEMSRARDIFRVAAARSKKKLRAYLGSNLAASSAYLLLVTGLTAALASDWVRWEIQEGGALARERNVPFVPILINADLSLLTRNFPGEALRFQAVELDYSDLNEVDTRLKQLIEHLVALPLWGKAWETDAHAKLGRLLDKHRNRREENPWRQMRRERKYAFRNHGRRYGP